MDSSFAIAIAVGLAVAGVVGGIAYATLKKKYATLEKAARVEADRVLADATKAAEAKRREASIEAKEKVLAASAEFEKTVTARRQEIQVLEKRVLQKEENLDRKLAAQERREEEYARKEKAVADTQKRADEIRVEAERLVDEQKKRLEQISGLTAVDAKRDLIKSIENEARVEAAGIMRRIEEEADRAVDAEGPPRHRHGDPAPRLGHGGRGDGLGRRASLRRSEGPDHRPGGTQHPGARSGDRRRPHHRRHARGDRHQRVRAAPPRGGAARPREAHRRRPHPSGAYRRDRREGPVGALGADPRTRERRRALEFGIPDLHPELIKLLGRLKFRTSYGQNVLQHSKEVAWLATNMTAELGGNVEVAKRAGLLHDIGKAIDREMDGTHLELGREVLKKFGESNEVIHGMECHHGDYEPRSLEAVLVNGADALSAARPGARREILETYVKRLEKLEHIADGFKGVQKAFAVQAGRELRIIVEANRVTDDEALWLSRDVAKKIEAELQYPGPDQGHGDPRDAVRRVRELSARTDR